MIQEVRFSDEFLVQIIVDVGQGKFTSLAIGASEA